MKAQWLLPAFVLGLAAGYGLSSRYSEDVPSAIHSPSALPAIKSHALPQPENDPSSSSAPRSLARPELPVPNTAKDLAALAAAGHWDELVRLAEASLLVAQGVEREAMRTQLEIAYGALIRKALLSDDQEAAVRLLAKAEDQLGESAPRLVQYAELKQQRLDLLGAMEDLQQALVLDPLLAEELYPLIRNLVMGLIEREDTPLAPNQQIQLLNKEIIADPGYPLYYAALGQRYFQQGRYAEAITQLEYALQLEPGLRVQLRPLLDAAIQRRDTPRLVEIPLLTQGDTHYVEVELNGSGHRYRFVLDTGASMVAITSQVAAELGITRLSELPMLELSTAKGIIRTPLTTLAAVRAGDARVTNVKTVILDGLEGADGLLGLSFLSRFNVDLNHSEQKLLLSERR